MPTPPADTTDLDSLLRSVSRSFYLSIRLLPAPLRAPVGVAYLLARTSDTVADSPVAPAGQRRDLLARMGEAIAATDSPTLAAELAALAQRQPDADEARLLMRWAEAFRAFVALEDADRADVRTVLGHILQGQDQDIERFPGDGPVNALPDASALETYIYLVAGSVGEFWTDVCARHLQPFATREVWQMRAFGRSFGCGLQLVNIVRDAGEDIALGRCYFPATELAAAGIEPARILQEPERFLPIWQHWQDEALARLQDGMTYALAVEARRVRAAVALPAILGRETLDRVRSAGTDALTARAKVGRRDVRRLLFRMGLRLASRTMLEAEWDNRGR